MLTQNDLDFIAAKGISSRQIDEQLHYFKTGFPYLPVVASASTEKGIQSIPEEVQTAYLDAWMDYLKKEREVVKFVPASGAASRMFKDLFEFLSTDYGTPVTPFEQAFFAGIHRFAFYTALDRFCLLNEGKPADELMASGNYKAVVENLLYSNAKFHENPSNGNQVVQCCVTDRCDEDNSHSFQFCERA